MRVAFILSDKDRENSVADAFLAGVELFGDEGIKIPKSGVVDTNAADVFCMIGVKSRKVFTQVKRAGKHVVFFDKGYFRHRGPSRTWEYWRVCVNDHHPTDYVETAKHSHLRWEYLAKRRMVEVKPWREAGDHIVYAGSSEKYHEFCGLPHPTEYARRIVRQLSKITDKPIIYRPKPTWTEAEPVEGARFSSSIESIADVLRAAHVLVTNGSNSSFDAVLMGIPSIVLGDAIARPISSTDLKDIVTPRLASDEERLQWLSNIAWCMFTELEMEMGIPWQTIKPQFDGGFMDDSLIEIIHGKSMKPSKAQLKQVGLWKKAWKKHPKSPSPQNTGKP